VGSISDAAAALTRVMRVAIVTTAPEMGGVSRHVLDLAQELDGLGHDVQVGSRADAEGIRERASQLRLRWQPLPRVVTRRADVWHLHVHNPLDMRVLPLLAARRVCSRGIVVMTEHLPRIERTDFTFSTDLPPDTKHGIPKPGASYLKPLMKRTQYRLCDGVIAVSRASADFMTQRFELPDGLVDLLYNGVRVPSTPPPLEVREPMRVVVVADLHWRKGVDVMLAAAAQAVMPWSLCIVGDGPEREKLESLARALPSGHPVEFAGRKSDAANAAAAGDVFCLPSRGESFAYVVLEAMACGRPVVASRVDGTDEAVAHERTGLLVPPDDAPALARALDRLATDQKLRRDMGRAAHARAWELFRLDAMVEGTLRLYAQFQAASRRKQWHS
jgi:glycosyltransferase involved in cell wall biosynthesis